MIGMNHLQSGLLALIRVIFGVAIILRGVDKLNGGLSHAIDAFAAQGYPAPDVTAPTVAMLEIFGGGAIVLGLFTRFFGVVFAVIMAAALYFEGLGDFDGAVALTAGIFLACIVLVALGAGPWSLDRLFFRKGSGIQYPLFADSAVQAQVAFAKSLNDYRPPRGNKHRPGPPSNGG